MNNILLVIILTLKLSNKKIMLYKNDNICYMHIITKKLLLKKKNALDV